MDNEEAAKLTHQREHETRIKMHEGVVSFGSEALKAAALLAGGSAAATLAFIGQIIEKKPQAAGDLSTALAAFALGLFASVIAMGISYLSQHAFADAIFKTRHDYTAPYIHETAGSKSAMRLGFSLQIASIVLCIGSYVAVLVGFFIAYRVIAGRL